ncbi:MAG: short-chain dehydrogenase/reductase [Acidimicrobiaceae bacterium]|nr:short-chain dehydrogenase/reductase [Acidimicrobiaceae bacterium]
MTTSLVTGCSTGIGLATAVELASRGHRVYASMRNEASCGPLLAAAEEAQTEVRILGLDVDDLASIEDGVERVLDNEGRLDVLVNNAGLGDLSSVEEADPHLLLRMFRTNVFGPIALIRSVLPSMRSAGSGTIVNVSSVSARIVSAYSGPYAATKCAMEAITQALAIEGASHGIRAFAIEPGFVKTPMIGKALATLRDASGPYKTVAGFIRDLYEDGLEGGEDPIKVARVIGDAIDSADATIQRPVGPSAEWVINGRESTADEAWIDLWTSRTQAEFGERFQELFGDPP